MKLLYETPMSNKSRANSKLITNITINKLLSQFLFHWNTIEIIVCGLCVCLVVAIITKYKVFEYVVFSL